MTYFTLVFKMNDFCHVETVREAVKICVKDLKQCDIASFEIKRSWVKRPVVVR